MHRLVASWFGTGFILRSMGRPDRGSGTVGALAALAVALAIGGDRWIWQLAAVFAVTLLSLWSSRPFADGDADPAWVVVDEAAGTFLAVIGLSLIPALAAFVVFRVADISKKFPGVSAAEKWSGSVGITFDDLVAGGWALAAGWILEYAFVR